MNVRKIVTAQTSGKKLFEERPVKTRKYYDDIPPVTETGAHPGDIADPWYSGDFERTWREVNDGCAALLKKITSRGRR